MGVRIQTWHPFTVQICVNGREVLAQQMRKTGIEFEKEGNCFTKIEKMHEVQELIDEQTSWDWEEILKRIAKTVNPSHEEMFGQGRDYFWSVYQSEWASDLYFKNSDQLNDLYEEMVLHAISDFKSPNVMRFLGNRVNKNGSIPKRCKGDIISSYQHRHEGS